MNPEGETNVEPGSTPPPVSEGVGAAGKALGLAAVKLLSVVGRTVFTAANVVSTRVGSVSRKLFESKNMGMTRCAGGHYYDPQKSSVCPLCASNGVPLSSALTRDSQSIPREIGASQQTVGFMVREKGIDPTVGWVVCIAGPERGRDFKIHSERNSIGRSPNMNISINDDSISRENHASIVFNPLKSSFKLLPGEARGLIYLNSEEVLQPVDLESGDKIKIGASELLFVPFAGTFFDWN